MFGIGKNFNEDDYWENVREARENPRYPWGDEPEYETANLYLEDDLEDIEDKWGWPVEELDEEDLIEIVKEYLSVKAVSAYWEPKCMCIIYTHEIA